MGEITQLLVALQLQTPATDGLAHGFHRLTANCRREIHINTTVLVHRLALSERVAEKSKLNDGVLFLPIDILTVYDPRLLRMQFKSALIEPLSKFPQHQLGLRFALAVDNTIISVATESNAAHMAP
jgi:hypothetical protein